MPSPIFRGILGLGIERNGLCHSSQWQAKGERGRQLFTCILEMVLMMQVRVSDLAMMASVLHTDHGCQGSTCTRKYEGEVRRQKTMG